MFASFRALNHRPFAWLWTGQSISKLGDSIYRIALLWWIVTYTDSATVLGSLLIAQTLPMLLFALVGGALADRYTRLSLMIIADIVRGILVSLLAVLVFADALALWHLYGIVIVFGGVEAVFPAAYRAAVPERTPADALPSANALTDLSATIGDVLGPLCAASLIALGGVPLAFLLDGLSFVVSIVCLLPLLKHASPHHVKQVPVICLTICASACAPLRGRRGCGSPSRWQGCPT